MSGRYNPPCLISYCVRAAHRVEMDVTDCRLCRLFLLFLLIMVFTGCATVPFDEPKPYSKTITDTADTNLGKRVSTWVDELNFLGDFRQANRRMHNKSFTADNQISIVGGRNIADEYFELKAGSEFVDFDVLAMGPIAAEISKSFDEYWNHSRAVPMDRIAANKTDEGLDSNRL